MTTVAAIVCGHTLERWDDIHRSIESLRVQSRPADQIIFSVDNNAELFAAAKAEFDTGDIDVVHNTGRRGVSGTRNAAARATNCQVLAYIDDDAVADICWLERLMSWYDDAKVLGVGGHAEPAWDAPAQEGPRWFPPSFNWVVGCSHSGIGSTAAPVRNFIGCNMSIRRDAWEAVGGFDESIGRVGADGGGGDETDFCIRVTTVLDGVIMNDPTAIVAHRVPAGRQNLAYFIKRCRSEGRSKAQIANQSGTDLALAEERKHLVTELPRSFFAGFADAAKGDLNGPMRSLAIVIGTAATGFGYIAGSIRQRPRSAPSNMDFEPIQVATIDLADDRHDSSLGRAVGKPTRLVVRRGHELVAVENFADLPPAGELRPRLRAAFPAAEILPASAPTVKTQIHGPADRSAAVVIATRDRAQSLRRCLESIETLDRTPDQIVVVDNAPSDDSTRDLVHDWNADRELQVTYVRCEQAGLARAHNAALPHLTADIAAFTDDDVLVDRHWLGQLVSAFDVGDRVSAVTGAILPAELETWPQAWVEETSNFTKGFTIERFSTDELPADPLFPFTAGSMGSGANMAFDTGWLVATGGFNNALGAGTTALGGDDLRSFYDVVMAGRELVFTPHAIVFHHHHRTPEAIERQAYGYGAGLGAFLMSVAVDQPTALLRMARRSVAAFRHAASVTSSQTSQVFPGEQRRTRRQRIGMLSGPLRYLRSHS